MKVRFFSDCCTSADVLTNLRRMYGALPPFDLTTGDDYTHAVILNCAMPDLTIPKACVIGFAHEPKPFLRLTSEFIQYAQAHIGKYFIGNAEGLPDPFIGGFAYMWHLEKPIQIKKTNFCSTSSCSIAFSSESKAFLEKTKFCSIMVSQNTLAPGHQYRHLLVQAILKTDLPIDIWGRGCQLYVLPRRIDMIGRLNQPVTDKRLKKSFTDERLMVAPYVYHIAIENYREPHYISEKVVNAMLYECVPVYLGCPNIDTYFPGATLILSGNVERDIEMLKQLYRNRRRIKEPIPSTEIYEKINLLNHLERLFE